MKNVKERKQPPINNGGLSEARLGRMHDVMHGYLERNVVPGLVTLVSRRGEVCADAIGTKALGGSEPMRRDTIFRIGSMTKPVTAVAAMILVEECALRLDEPVDGLLPELTDRKVLRTIDSALDDTVPANRPITLRDILTLRLGIGAIMAPPEQYPIQRAMDAAELTPGFERPSLSSDEWMKRLGVLPLVHHPGERWMYDTGSDVLGVLISRATDQPLEFFFRERIFEPLGMEDTGFYVPAGKLDRLANCYSTNPESGALELFDDARESDWRYPPIFESGSGGLVSTADDYLAFCQMMLNNGKRGDERILSRPSVELMITDQLTPVQKSEANMFFGDNSGWGFGMGVITGRDGLSPTPGTFGWAGGYGTSGYSDPGEDMVVILMTQRLTDSPVSARLFNDSWTLAYHAIDD